MKSLIDWLIRAYQVAMPAVTLWDFVWHTPIIAIGLTIINTSVSTLAYKQALLLSILIYVRFTHSITWAPYLSNRPRLEAKNILTGNLDKDGVLLYRSIRTSCPVPTENVACITASATVLEGVSRSRNALLNGNTRDYDWDSGYTCHQLGSGCIMIQLAQPYVVSSMR